MNKKIILCFLVVLACVNIHAQKLMKSFRDDFLVQLYSSCDEQMRKDMQNIQTPVKEFVYQENDTSVLEDKLYRIVQEKQAKDRQLLCYESKDFYAFMFFDENISTIQFEFFYISPDNKICSEKLLNNTGKYYQRIKTKSNQRYYFHQEWGFLEIKQNQLSLLNCYYEISKQKNESKFLLIPFEGTNTLVWKKPSETGYVLAF